MKTQYYGIGFSGLLTIILFIGLKLTGYISWSWWWVLSPLWFGLGIVIAALLLILCSRSYGSRQACLEVLAVCAVIGLAVLLVGH
ncbi:hypothetical protein LCGC14_1791420 [marine sediment metagenome]|uniref:Uncharacterized protein n=1 Tax=marine sediment metagenome TaxID=412755 RepID=A0A0F9GSF8_9ZZZZ